MSAKMCLNTIEMWFLVKRKPAFFGLFFNLFPRIRNYGSRAKGASFSNLANILEKNEHIGRERIHLNPFKFWDFDFEKAQGLYVHEPHQTVKARCKAQCLSFKHTARTNNFLQNREA